MVLLTRYIGRTGIPAFEEGAVLINPTASPGWKFAVIAFLSHKSALPGKMVFVSSFSDEIRLKPQNLQILNRSTPTPPTLGPM